MQSQSPAQNQHQNVIEGRVNLVPTVSVLIEEQVKKERFSLSPPANCSTSQNLYELTETNQNDYTSLSPPPVPRPSHLPAPNLNGFRLPYQLRPARGAHDRIRYSSYYSHPINDGAHAGEPLILHHSQYPHIVIAFSRQPQTAFAYPLTRPQHYTRTPAFYSYLHGAHPYISASPSRCYNTQAATRALVSANEDLAMLRYKLAEEKELNERTRYMHEKEVSEHFNTKLQLEICRAQLYEAQFQLNRRRS